MIEQAYVTNYRSEMGRSSYLLHCPCGNVWRVYVWSWAGNGKVRCKICKREHKYLTVLAKR